MNKVLFIFNKGNAIGGVWNVNQLIANKLLDDNYEIIYLAIREYDKNIAPCCDKRIKYYTINPNTKWETARGSKIIESLKKGQLLQAIKDYKFYKKDKRALLRDFKKTKKIITAINPNYIITSHYEQLDAIPNSYLKKTINLNHVVFEKVLEIKNWIKTYNKYRDKLAKFVWLSKETNKRAKEYGIENSVCIYNAVRFESQEISDVIHNKKLVAICRFSEEKRIELMLEIVNEVLNRNKEWKFELYGEGEILEKGKKIIENNPRIEMCGLTNNPKEVLLSSSINLNTSLFEGFSLSILEANECRCSYYYL